MVVARVGEAKAGATVAEKTVAATVAGEMAVVETAAVARVAD